MPHHFTKNTVSASAWCLKCNKQTMHRIDTGRIGPCLVCIEKLDTQAAVEHEPEPKQEGFKF